MAGIFFFLPFGERGRLVEDTGLSIPPDKAPSAKEPKIVFQYPDALKGEINNTGHPFPTGPTDSAANQTPNPLTKTP